jgi:hypothetical protein
MSRTEVLSLFFPLRGCEYQEQRTQDKSLLLIYDKYARSLSLTLPLTHTYTHSLSLFLSHTLSFTHSLSLSLLLPLSLTSLVSLLL